MAARSSRIQQIFFSFIIICFVCFPARAKYGGGTGEPNDPYQIDTAQDLIDLGNEPNDYDKSFILTADIDLSGMLFDRAVIAPDTNDAADWFQGASFSGCLEGRGHVIRHLQIQGQDYVGLFGRLGDGAVITNLGLESVDVRGHWYIGGLVGFNFYKGIISSSHSTGTVSGDWYIGGLVGFNYGIITLSYSTDTVSGNSRVGGLVGENSGSIWSSYSNGTINGEQQRVGGLVGENGPDGNILSSYSTGTVRGNEYIGGLVGINYGNLSSSYSRGTIRGGMWWTGGLVGCNFAGSISSSYSTGMVSGDYFIGGLVGINNNGGSITTSFWDTQTSGVNVSDGGLGRSTAQMQNINTFLNADWDFTGETDNGPCDFWHFQEGAYPSLAVFSGVVPDEPNGAGTLDDPYLITDVNGLGYVWYRPLAHYRLISDVDLSGMTWRMAVVPWFGGSFDGNDFCIRSLHIDGAGHLGLFGILGYGSEVTNLGLEDISISGIGNYVGGLAGSNFYSCILSCYSTGTIRGKQWIGGLVGYNFDGTISSSCNISTVSGDEDVGGLAGYHSGSISSSYNTGTVNGDNEVGGLAGFSYGHISSCYNTGTVSGDQKVGGLVGLNRDKPISSSYSTGMVSGNKDVGGLVGFNDDGSIDSSFWDIETSGLTESAGGTALSTADMKDINTFLDAGWDFVDETTNGTEDIWFMPEDDYPSLKWEEE